LIISHILLAVPSTYKMQKLLYTNQLQIIQCQNFIFDKFDIFDTFWHFAQWKFDRSSILFWI